jgi:hypothetical protein
MSAEVENYIKLHSKSQTSGFLLTLLFGPLGLLYSSVIGGVILLVIAVVAAATIIVPVICWLISIVLSFAFISDFNAKIAAEVKLKYPE